jgi:hypothetical protein
MTHTRGRRSADSLPDLGFTTTSCLIVIDLRVRVSAILRCSAHLTRVHSSRHLYEYRKSQIYVFVYTILLIYILKTTGDNIQPAREYQGTSYKTPARFLSLD